ncbi:MAG: dTDP-4-dehydrorhamnose reductase [Paracoccaceae bacterium]
MKILMFGATGQVAREVLRRAGPVKVTALGRDRADLSDPEACAAAVREADADAVLNAAAWTQVDGAEAEPEAAQTVNAAAPGAMAAAAAARGLPFVQISTDYVFDGSGDAPWREDDKTGPLGVYGGAKLAAERAVAEAGGAHAILRTSWVFSAHGANFVKTMLRLGAERGALSIVDDQIGGPTPAAAIADACLAIARAQTEGKGRSGVFHFSGQPAVSWRAFAEAIFAEAGLSVAVTPIGTADYPTPARRPLNSRLDCAKIAAVYGLQAPDWRAGLKDVVKELNS